METTQSSIYEDGNECFENDWVIGLFLHRQSPINLLWISFIRLFVYDHVLFLVHSIAPRYRHIYSLIYNISYPVSVSRTTVLSCHPAFVRSFARCCKLLVSTKDLLCNIRTVLSLFRVAKFGSVVVSLHSEVLLTASNEWLRLGRYSWFFFHAVFSCVFSLSRVIYATAAKGWKNIYSTSARYLSLGTATPTSAVSATAPMQNRRRPLQLSWPFSWHEQHVTITFLFCYCSIY